MIYIAPEDEMTPVIKELHDYFTKKGITPKIMDSGTEISVTIGKTSVVVSHWRIQPRHNISVGICISGGISSVHVAYDRFNLTSEVFEFVNRKIPEIVSDLSNLHAIFKEES
jgi:hypothetical protein